jgi:hypothetical protein
VITKRQIVALAAVAAVAVALALPATAGAQTCQPGDPTASQYCPATDIGVEVSQSGSGGGGGGEVASSGGGSLPFTGLDVPALLAVALALTCSGIALRRLTAGAERF